MSIAAQNSVFSIAPQAAKTGAEGTFTPGSYSWYRYRVPRIAGGPIQLQQMFPQETGTLTPSGLYKAGAYYMTEVDLIPRLENTLGWLLYGAMGNVSSVTGKVYNGADTFTNQVGVNSHIFRFDPANQAKQPWLAIRKYIPGTTTSEAYGEYAYDAKVANLRLNVPGAGIVTSTLAFQGREFRMPSATDVNAWTYANSYEDVTTVPNAGQGTVKLGGEKLSLTALTIDVVNGLSQPEQEMVIGSYFPDDFIALSRSVNLRATVKWANATLWKQIFNGGANAVDWTMLPFSKKTAAGTTALEATFQGDVISNTSVPHALKVFANNVSLSLDQNSIELQAGNLVTFNINISVIQPTDNSDYLQIALVNGTSGYTWPTT